MSEIDDLVKELRGEIPYRSDAPRLMEAAAAMLQTLSAESARLMELAYAPDGRTHRRMTFDEAAKRGAAEARLAEAVEALKTANLYCNRNSMPREAVHQIETVLGVVGSALDSPESSGDRK